LERPAFDHESGFSSPAALRTALEAILNEPVASVRDRERAALHEILSRTNDRCVLLGVGSFGRRALAELIRIGIKPLAISDNNERLWGTEIDGTPVLSPQEAAKRFGGDATFFITIRNERHWYKETHDQLRSLGCSHIANASALGWRFSDKLLPFLLYDLPHKLYEQADQVLGASGLWEDDASRFEYLAHIRLRALGEMRDIPGPISESYFLDGVFDAVPDERLLDCGAFDGDTIRAVLARQPHVQAIEAVEADSRSFEKLKNYVSSLDSNSQVKIRVHKCAVGAERGTVCFSDTGNVDSRVSHSGGTVVDLFTIDELLEDRPVTMIKMDIEGAEFDALQGARGVIERDFPLLSICAYHLQEDIWRLPLLMREFNPEYRMYLKTYCGDGIQSVVYAVPPSRILH
jgi:FkbM family methyltransferase